MAAPTSLRPGSRALFTEEHDAFRETVRTFIERAVLPHDQEWEQQHHPDRSLFTTAGEQGLLLFGAPEEYGGVGIDDFRFNAVVSEEFGRHGLSAPGLALSLQNDVLGPYFLELTNDEQKARWLPGLVSGELVSAIGMTEPGTGSDVAAIRTRAVRDGDDYVVDGAKTFISNGLNADLVVTAVRTGDDPHKGLSLLVIETDAPGFDRHLLSKIGLHGQDTCELSFTGVRVPAANLLGAEGEGFTHLMRNLSQERLSLAVLALAAAEGVLENTLDYVQERTAFGRPVGSFQNSRFVLAEVATELDVTRTFVDDCLAEHLRGELGAARAAKAKWWCTDVQARTADRCLQLYGGYGYMSEYPVSRAFVEARVQKIYGGTNEIMKEIVGRDLGL
ncbi:acyl-CoA dehydrogenase family protein [Actinomycetospora chibensis]|uniref:Acyl-[acyl-carrier-protein] dehydrogenase MbtN n=1 Tax=Actinomycetospora chibensis TaxID=663606 RepID=A0ABV9RFL9_9PSEU|nr:acyl-CoA dehydrogenase family protein [Actinomycetospora chibensis]MDD7925050.1 acyl-CoA dehydrogenase family protein [Actinomycetospora chibensis]